ncbi:MAG: hypothetical protein AAGA68_27480, partial [Pseudomonadota bacterium]
MSVSELSQSVRRAQAQMVESEETALMMRALRGQNVNDDDAQMDGISMRVVEMRRGERGLPTSYDADILSDYFSERPGAVLSRVSQIATTSAGLVAGY